MKAYVYTDPKGDNVQQLTERVEYENFGRLVSDMRAKHGDNLAKIVQVGDAGFRGDVWRKTYTMRDSEVNIIPAPKSSPFGGLLFGVLLIACIVAAVWLVTSFYYYVGLPDYETIRATAEALR